jgi:aryl-alcohol dehydrogenase-like predicted oxidoreductase
VARAFGALENLAARDAIQFYGTATWHAYRRPPGATDALSLSRMVEIARAEGGQNHRFRFVQLPLSVVMPEAFTQRTETVDGRARSVLDVAAELGITVVASASLMQARLARGLPAVFAEAIPGALTDAQRAIQFARSTPGIAVALVGMSSAAHVQENSQLASVPPIPAERFLRLFQPA